MQTITLKNITLGFLAILLTVGFYAMTAETTHAASDRISSSTARAKIKNIRTERASSTISTSTTPSSTINATCMVTVVTKREDTLKTAWTELTEKLTIALIARAEGLVAAWGQTENKDRLETNKATWAAWKEAKLAAQKDFKNSRKQAWDSFKKAAKAECKVTLPKEEGLEQTASDSIAI